MDGWGSFIAWSHIGCCDFRMCFGIPAATHSWETLPVAWHSAPDGNISDSAAR